MKPLSRMALNRWNASFNKAHFEVLREENSQYLAIAPERFCCHTLGSSSTVSGSEYQFGASLSPAKPRVMTHGTYDNPATRGLFKIVFSDCEFENLSEFG